MKKIILTIVLIIVSTISFCLDAQNNIKIIDSDSNESISYVVITTIENSDRVTSDIDGIINFKIKRNHNYIFKRLGYKDLQLDGNQIINNDAVKMEMLPVELNPITVTADAAWINLNRAISNTYKSLPERPNYLSCFKQDKIEVNSLAVVKAKAIYVSKISRIFEMGKGCSSQLKLKGLEIISNENFKTESVEKFSYYEAPFVNEFLVGHNKKDDNNISFYYVDVNDSVLIIGYSPKMKFNPKSYIITSGRFIIDKRDWKLLRIDSDINPRMLKFQNEKVMGNPKKELLYQKLIRSIYFSKKGFPNKLVERLEYLNKNDESRTLWVNTTSHVYKEISEKEFETVPKRKVESKSIIFQKSTFTPSFDSEFDKGFQ